MILSIRKGVRLVFSLQKPYEFSLLIHHIPFVLFLLMLLDLRGNHKLITVHLTMLGEGCMNPQSCQGTE